MTLRLLLFLLIALILSACQGLVSSAGEAADLPTRLAAAATITPSPTAVIPPEEGFPAATVPMTWTPEALAKFASPTPAGLASITPRPTNTPWPIFTPTGTATGTPTNTPEATPTGTPTPTANPANLNRNGVNLLPNPSFEGGWHHVSGLPELQVPDNWILGWLEGKNSLDKDPWNRFVRPESRVLNKDFLPAREHSLFIWDGGQTVKIFKGQGALYFWLVTNVYLEPGSYVFDINVFPDMVEEYEGSNKIWASDPLSGELRFIVESEVGDWILPEFGTKNNYRYAFAVNEAHFVRLGVAFRGRWAIDNNGWFMDDWSLVQIAPA